MKKFAKLFYLVLISILIVSCEKDEITTIGGEQSPMGEVGNKVSSSSAAIAGLSSFTATVVSLENGVSSYSGSAVVTNAAIKNILSNFPECKVNGNNVTASGIKFKSTNKGIQSVSGLSSGVIVEYDAVVGDKYPTGDGHTRKVVSRSTSDDYSYGFFDIKVIKVEEDVNAQGVQKITYWANHRFGLVGIEFKFDDGTTAKFPIYNSYEND